MPGISPPENDQVIVRGQGDGFLVIETMMRRCRRHIRDITDSPAFVACTQVGIEAGVAGRGVLAVDPEWPIDRQYTADREYAPSPGQ